MNHLAARDALTATVKRVCVDERAGHATPSVFAVFETADPEAPLIGLVTLEQASRFSHRIFADLLPRHRAEPVAEDVDLETVSVRLEAADASALPVLNSGGRLLGAITRESLWAAMLTQQRALFAEVANRESQQRAMLNAIPDELLCVDAQGRLLPIGRIAEANDGATVPPVIANRVLERRDSVGKLLTEVFPEDVAATLTEGIARSLATRKSCHASFMIASPVGTSQYEARFVSWGTGNVLIICRDATEVNSLRAKLVISERMVSIGTLAAGVAHEINNPLTYISTNLELVRELLSVEIPHHASLRETTPLLDDIREGVDRVRRTVRDLKLFSRAEEPSRALVDLKDVLGRAVSIANHEVRHRARLTFAYGEVSLVDANASQLGQVFLNLLVNAAQSITEGAADQNEIHIATRGDRQGHAVVEIHDTGSGISNENKARIFAPFFTTKGAGVGTGLGLSICHGIVVAHGGDIEVESTVGKGSVFRVVLPVSTIAPPTPLQSQLPEAPRLRSPPIGRFLVVDDETAILKTYARLLGASQCTLCSSGQQALDLQRRGERFDAILCDVMMPQTSGMDVYQELIRIAPEQAARIIFVTGGAFTERMRQFLAERSNPILEKPFETSRLFDCLVDIIGRKGL